jgi:choline kinase
MIAVILAAGSSYRMRPLTDHMPKTLLTIGGKPVLGQILENIAASGIKNILMVTGYQEEMIKEYVQANQHGMTFQFITNEIYSTTSDSVSLFKTKPHVQGQDIVLIDADLWFYPGALAKLLQTKEADVVAINSKSFLDVEAVKVILDGTSRILEMGKPVEINKAIGEAVGIRKFSASYMEKLYKVLERRIMKERIVDQVFEYSVQELLDHDVPLYAVDTCEWPSIEMDTPEDYERAKSLIAQYEATISSSAKQ